MRDYAWAIIGPWTHPWEENSPGLFNSQVTATWHQPTRRKEKKNLCGDVFSKSKTSSLTLSIQGNSKSTMLLFLTHFINFKNIILFLFNIIISLVKNISFLFAM